MDDAAAGTPGARPFFKKTGRLRAAGAMGRAARALEVGCGTGNYIIAVQFVSGCTAQGIDISEEMLVHAERRDSPVGFSVGTAEFLDVPDGSLDFIFTVDVVHHLGSPADHYREAYRAMAPGGRVCTVTLSEDMFRNTMALRKYFPETIEGNLEAIWHIQLADNPGRNEPGTGEINYPYLFDHLDKIGYEGWIGCEYRPLTDTVAGLGWAAPYFG